MTLDKAHQVCLLGQGKQCCRYLALGKSGLFCLKLDAEFKPLLDARVEASLIVAVGNNCEGEAAIL